MTLFAATAAVTLVLDQATKAIVRASIEPGVSIPLIEDVLHLTHVRNTGAAFGLLPGQQPMFVAVALIVIAGVVAYLWLMKPTSRIELLALGLVAGGAVGNVIDRAASGRVTDFIDVQVIPIFNIADSGIVVGAIALVVWTLLAPAPRPTDEGLVEPHGEEGATSDPGSLPAVAEE